MNGSRPAPKSRRRAGALMALASLIGMVSVHALAQEDLARVVVTGSNIRAAQKEGASAVQVFSAKDLAATGKTNVADVLRTISANSGNSYNEQFTGSFSAGTAGLSLRGLGQKNTLILVNGKRVSSYATAQNLQEKLARAPVDVVGHDHVRALREHGEQRRRDRRHAAGEQQRVLGVLQGGQLALRHPLGGIAVAAVLLALDAPLEVIGELGGVGEGVGRGLDDGLGRGRGELGPRLAAVNRPCARTAARGSIGRHVTAPAA